LEGFCIFQCFVNILVAAVFIPAFLVSNVENLVLVIGSLANLALLAVFGSIAIFDAWYAYSHWVAIVDLPVVVFGINACWINVLYLSPQLPGKLLLARLSAYTPGFAEASFQVPRNKRVEFARNWKNDQI
jgi:hypothetical protein